MAEPLQPGQVAIQYAQHSRLGPDWRREDLRIPWTRLYWIRDGEARIRVAGQTVPLQPGRLYVIPAGTPFGCWCDRFLELDWAHINVTTTTGQDLVSCLAPPPVVHPREQTHTTELFGRLVRTFRSGAPGEALMTSGLICEILAIVANATPVPPEPRTLDPRLRPVLSYIETRLEDPIRIADLAAMAHLTPSWFSRLFRRELGQPPGQYLCARRIAAASEWLRTTDAPLTAIATKTGFADAFHLSRTFKRTTGQPPSTYRQQARSPLP